MSERKDGRTIEALKRIPFLIVQVNFVIRVPVHHCDVTWTF